VASVIPRWRCRPVHDPSLTRRFNVQIPHRHRIRVEIASSAHPKFAVNLGTGSDDTIATEGVIARNVLHHDADRPSRLALTVVPTSGS
jgi:predicted acyl esterase